MLVGKVKSSGPSKPNTSQSHFLSAKPNGTGSVSAAQAKKKAGASSSTSHIMAIKQEAHQKYGAEHVKPSTRKSGLGGFLQLSDQPLGKQRKSLLVDDNVLLGNNHGRPSPKTNVDALFQPPSDEGEMIRLIHNLQLNGFEQVPLALGQLLEILRGLLELSETRLCLDLMDVLADSRHGASAVAVTTTDMWGFVRENPNINVDAAKLLTTVVHSPEKIHFGVDATFQRSATLKKRAEAIERRAGKVPSTASSPVHAQSSHVPSTASSPVHAQSGQMFQKTASLNTASSPVHAQSGQMFQKTASSPVQAPQNSTKTECSDSPVASGSAPPKAESHEETNLDVGARISLNNQQINVAPSLPLPGKTELNTETRSDAMSPRHFAHHDKPVAPRPLNPTTSTSNNFMTVSHINTADVPGVASSNAVASVTFVANDDSPINSKTKKQANFRGHISENNFQKENTELKKAQFHNPDYDGAVEVDLDDEDEEGCESVSSLSASMNWPDVSRGPRQSILKGPKIPGQRITGGARPSVAFSTLGIFKEEDFSTDGHLSSQVSSCTASKSVGFGDEASDESTSPSNPLGSLSAIAALNQNGTLGEDALASLMSGNPYMDEVDEMEEFEDVADNVLSEPDFRWLIHPNSTGRVIWDILSLVIIVTESILVPLNVGFDASIHPIWHWFTTCWFCIDMVLSMITGYYEDGVLIMQQSMILKNYLSTTFVVDAVSTFPWEQVLGGSADEEAEGRKLIKIARFGRILRLTRLLRLMKLNNLLTRLEEVLPGRGVTVAMSLLKMVFVFGILCHLSACIWGFIGNPDKMDHSSAGEPPHDKDTCVPDGACEASIVGSPWIHRYGLDKRGGSGVEGDLLITQYLTALRFATATITNSDGGIQPGWWGERVYTIIMMVLSFGICSTILSQIVVIMEKFTAETAQFKENMGAVKEYMVARKVPGTLRGKVKRYLEFQFYSKQRGGDGIEYLEQLSPWLRLELKEHLNGQILTRHPLFRNMPPIAFRRACAMATTILYAPGDIVAQRGHNATCMFFIVLGRLKVLEPKGSVSKRDSLQKKPEKRWSQGQDDKGFRQDIFEAPGWIGDQCLFKEMTRMRTVVCLTHAELLTLPSDAFDEIIAEFPLVMPWYSDLQVKVECGDLISAGIQCKTCKGFGHPNEDCPLATRDSTQGIMDVFARKSKFANFARKTIAKVASKHRGGIIASGSGSEEVNQFSKVIAPGADDEQDSGLERRKNQRRGGAQPLKKKQELPKVEEQEDSSTGVKPLPSIASEGAEPPPNKEPSPEVNQYSV